MDELLTLPRMARRVGVTQDWLKEQADAGNVPCLKTGTRRYLFNTTAVEEALASLAAQTRQVGDCGATNPRWVEDACHDE